MRSLADRMRAYEQQKARLADTEAKLKTAEKKARTRRLIEAGGLVEKAGLSELGNEVLYGALLSLRGSRENTKLLDQWAAAGREALEREARNGESGNEPIILTFPAPVAKDIVLVLRAGGFRFNRVLQHWEGLASFGEAEKLAESYGGNARRVAASAAAPTPARTMEAAE